MKWLTIKEAADLADVNYGSMRTRVYSYKWYNVNRINGIAHISSAELINRGTYKPGSKGKGYHQRSYANGYAAGVDWARKRYAPHMPPDSDIKLPVSVRCPRP